MTAVHAAAEGASLIYRRTADSLAGKTLATTQRSPLERVLEPAA